MKQLKNQIIDFMENYDNENYLISKDKLNSIKEIFIENLNRSEDNYIFKSSTGEGQKAIIPWICIFDKDISTGAKKGVYVSILFQADMRGFFVSLNQGYEHIESIYKKKKVIEVATNKIAEYYRNILDIKKMSRTIDLKSENKNTNLPKGYEWCNICGQYISIGDIKEIPELILETLENFMCIYDELKEYNNMHDYFLIVENIFNIVNLSLDKKAENDYFESIAKKRDGMQLLETYESPLKDSGVKKDKKRKSGKFYGISDDEKKEIGDIGENYVIEFEKNRLKAILNETKVEKITHISKTNDSAGYDIQSFDENGKEIFIEVKTTTSKINTPFLMSANEYKIMQELSDAYYIYRVFNIKNQPKVYIINYTEMCKYTFETSIYKVNY